MVVNGEQIGTVAVPPAPPRWVVVEEYGATLAWVGLALLVSGAVVASLLIFRPTHNRLRSLEVAARALGEGRTGVRASEAGGTRSRGWRVNSIAWPTISSSAPPPFRHPTRRAVSCSPMSRTS